MVAGLLLLVGAVLLVFGFYRLVQKTNNSPTLRFILPGRQFESGDFWSIAPWVGGTVIVGLFLIWGGLPSVGGDGSNRNESAAAFHSPPETKPKFPRREPDGAGGTTVYLSPEDWYWIDSDGQVTRSRGKGCRFHPGCR